MAKIDKVNPMCGCVMPVVPTIFSDGCLTLPEQVNKLTYKTNEVIEQTNQNTEYVNKAVENSETALNEARNAIDEIPTLVREGTEEYLAENGAPRLNPGATIDGVKFDGTKNITHIGVCNSAIDAVNKVINMLDGQYPDSLTNYLMLVKFSYGSNSLNNATINIQGSEYAAIPVQNPTTNTRNIPKIPAGGWLVVAYSSGAFNVVAAGTPEFADEARRLADGNTINGTPFTGENAITIACNTASAANENEKIITTGSQSGVTLQNGSVILVRFLAGNTAEGAITFKIGNASAEAKQAYYNGSTQGLPNLPSNATMLFVYANDSWIGSYVGTGGGSGEGYTLPPASATTLGGVKIGSGINVTADGVISAEGGGGTPYELPAATTTTLGGIKVGDNLTITPDGKLSANAGAYELPVATSAILGGVKVGDGLSVTQDGKISVTAGSSYELPIATKDTLGGIKLGKAMRDFAHNGSVELSFGEGISYNSENDYYYAPRATNESAGIVFPARPLTVVDTQLTVSYVEPIFNNGGNLDVKVASATQKGVVKIGSGLKMGESGTSEYGVLSNAYTFAYDASTATLNITGP